MNSEKITTTAFMKPQIHDRVIKRTFFVKIFIGF